MITSRHTLVCFSTIETGEDAEKPRRSGPWLYLVATNGHCRLEHERVELQFAGIDVAG